MLLNPCKCGRNASFDVGERVEGERHFVACDDCTRSTMDYLTRNEAVSAWNEHNPPKPRSVSEFDALRQDRKDLDAVNARVAELEELCVTMREELDGLLYGAGE